MTTKPTNQLEIFHATIITPESLFMKQQHSVTLTPRPEHIAATRDLLEQCAARVVARRDEGGPLAWSAAFDSARGCFQVEALFADDAAVAFHQANIKDLVAQFGTMMAARPETVIREVFAAG